MEYFYEKVLVRVDFPHFLQASIKSEPTAKKQTPHTLCPVCHPRDKVAPENKMGGKRPSALCLVSFGTLSNFSLSLLRLLFLFFFFFFSLHFPTQALTLLLQAAQIFSKNVTDDPIYLRSATLGLRDFWGHVQ